MPRVYALNPVLYKPIQIWCTQLMVFIHLMPGLKTRVDPREVPIHSRLPITEKNKLIMVSAERKEIHRKKEGNNLITYIVG
jgi:hypothetical protein